MKRATCLVAAALVAASSWVTTASAAAAAVTGPPLASSWNIATSGSAGSSGDLEFRITPADGSNPIDITVPVISGANQDSVARSINRALSSQLRRDRYSVQLGENSNVLVSDPRGRPNFSIELVDSGIENVRVAVKSVTPTAPPTVPEQAAPATSPATPRPAIEPSPPQETPPASETAPTPVPENTPPAAPPPMGSPAMPSPTPPAEASPPAPDPSQPSTTGETPGAPASTPPPHP
jgi:hypothetical protein